MDITKVLLLLQDNEFKFVFLDIFMSVKLLYEQSMSVKLVLLLMSKRERLFRVQYNCVSVVLFNISSKTREL